MQLITAVSKRSGPWGGLIIPAQPPINYSFEPAANLLQNCPYETEDPNPKGLTICNQGSFPGTYYLPGVQTAIGFDNMTAFYEQLRPTTRQSTELSFDPRQPPAKRHSMIA